MNYCDKIHYSIYTTGLATFDEMVDDLLAQLPETSRFSVWHFSASLTTTSNMYPVASC